MLERILIPVLITGMLVTGTANTLLTKWQDQVCVKNCDSDDQSQRHYFEQPVIQTLQMFIGEMGCWLVVGVFALHSKWLDRQRGLNGYEPVADEDTSVIPKPTPTTAALVPNSDSRERLSGYKVLLLALPACCDIAGTTLMNVGLLFVVASIYQMTRGALVLFVGLFSVIFLKRRLRSYQWVALVVVVLGVGIVGMAGALHKDEKKPIVEPENSKILQSTQTDVALRTVIGVFLIAGAQIFTATQFVLEEFILEKYALEPLKVVGWEGVFGFLVTVVGMFVLHYTVGVTESGRGGYFDAAEGLRQVRDFPTVLYTSFLIMISIGGFNYFGISVTRSISATARSIIDTCRTLFIWIVSLSLGWESFKWLQVLGFALLVYGTFLFNDLVQEPLRSCWLARPDKGKVATHTRDAEQHEELLPEHPVEHS